MANGYDTETILDTNPQGDWWNQNVPPDTAPPPPSAPSQPPQAATGGQPQGNGLGWVTDALSGVQSTDDPSYWMSHIQNDPKAMAGDPSAIAYWQDRIQRGDGSALVKSGQLQKFNDSPSGGSQGSPLAAIGQYTPPPVTPYSSYTPPPAPTPTHYVAPTAAEARQTPGFQSAIETADQGIQRSALARAGLNGGMLKDIGTWNVNAADQNYGNLVNQGLAINSQNNGLDLAAYNANVNANLGAGNLNLAGTGQQFQQQYQPGWNAYTFGANYGLQANQQQFGQGLARDQFNLGAQNQYWNQGFNENKNAYDQYDNSQKTAFDQWFKISQSGNPGNPYT